MLQAINPPGFSIPGISQPMLVEGGRLLILSGHVPFDAKGKLSGSDLASQLDQVSRTSPPRWRQREPTSLRLLASRFMF